MGVDEDRKHAFRFMELNKAHSAHVSREIVNPFHSLGGLVAGGQFPEVEGEIFHIIEFLVPFSKRLQIHRPDIFDSLLAQMGHQMPPDKAPCTCDKNIGFRMSSFCHCKTMPYSCRVFNGLLHRKN